MGHLNSRSKNRGVAESFEADRASRDWQLCSLSFFSPEEQEFQKVKAKNMDKYMDVVNKAYERYQKEHG
ncbi:hypothetical protein [Micromonospora fulviviridis]|uniref:hypothetical protein n=1 Tax=Micromonospora fulviviridis TaxID=47860 RepID=UPI00378D795A